MRHRFRDTYVDGRAYIAGDIYTPKEKKDLVPGDEIEWLYARKLSACRHLAIVESIEWPYVLRLRSE